MEMDAENFFDLAVGWAIRGLGLVNEVPGIGIGFGSANKFRKSLQGWSQHTEAMQQQGLTIHVHNPRDPKDSFYPVL
jgi:hypothetical protein